MRKENNDAEKNEAAGAVPSGAATDAEELTDVRIKEALRDSARRERVLFADETLVNEVIGRYLEELAAAASVPVVRGFSALRPVRKPRTLAEAKEIVDGG